MVQSTCRVVLALLSGVTCQSQQTKSSHDIICQPGFAPSQLEVSYPNTPCEPCIELSTAYFGNNLRSIPEYPIEDFQSCRSLCQKEPRCLYFTYDKKNEWCYLKHSKKTTESNKKDSRFISGSQSLLCENEEENEVDTDTDVKIDTTEDQQTYTDTTRESSEKPDFPEKPRNKPRESESSSKKPPKRNSSRTPIVSIYHDDGSRTVLTAIPASFGMIISNTTKVSGRLYLLDSLMCSPSPILLYSLEPVDHIGSFAVISRGGCRFAEKAENAAKAGFTGVIILDDQEDTDTKHISGKHTELLEKVPVIFLLRKEARILMDHLRDKSTLVATIQDSGSFSWYGRRPTTPLKLPQDFKNGFLLGMKDPILWHYRQFGKSPKTAPTTTTTTTNRPVLVVSEKQEQEPVNLTPLTVGSLVVGGLLAFLLIISVSTLIFSWHRRRARRRANHTRCQLAIRNMENQKSAAHDNDGFTSDSGANPGASKQFPKSAKFLLECPVCLELAWPPKKIFQCKEGHIICEVCKSNPNMKVCPMCRIPFGSTFTSRNRQLEELARTLQEEEYSDLNDQPSAPPLPDLTVGTSSHPIPNSVFSSPSTEDLTAITHTVEISIEPMAPPDDGEFADIVLEPRPSSAVRRTSTSSIRSGPLTVVLPPE